MRRITDIIQKEYEQFSPTERRIASFIIDHIDDLATYNSVELSRQCNTSKTTISRMFRRLGYANFKEAREELRKLRQSGIPMPGAGLKAGSSLIERHLESEKRNFESISTFSEKYSFGEVAEVIGKANKVFILGYRNSYPVALHFRQQLVQIRSDVYLLPQPGQTVSEDLVDATTEDIVIYMAFHRRHSGFQSILNTLSKKKIPTLLMCEKNSGLDLSEYKWALEIPLETVSAFDSYALPMSIVSLLSNLILHHRLELGRNRIHDINELYESTKELELIFS